MAEELNRCIMCGHFYKGVKHSCPDISNPPPPPSGPKPVPVPKKPR